MEIDNLELKLNFTNGKSITSKLAYDLIEDMYKLHPSVHFISDVIDTMKKDAETEEKYK
jgi:hypothetical protein